MNYICEIQNKILTFIQPWMITWCMYSWNFNVQTQSTDIFLNHCKCVHLAEGLEFGLHNEVIFTEFTAARVWALDPLLQAGLMDKPQTSCTVAGCYQRALIIPLTVTNPTVYLQMERERETVFNVLSSYNLAEATQPNTVHQGYSAKWEWKLSK